MITDAGCWTGVVCGGRSEKHKNDNKQFCGLPELGTRLLASNYFPYRKGGNVLESKETLCLILQMSVEDKGANYLPGGGYIVRGVNETSPFSTYSITSSHLLKGAPSTIV